MTILGAFHCGDYLLLAADSKAVDGQVPHTIKKMEKRDDPPLAWWFSGSESLGLQFSRWVSTYQFEDGMDWYSFAPVAKDEVTRLNGTRVKDAARLAIPPDRIRSELITVLIIGFLQDKPEILEIDDTGNWELHGDIGNAFVGGAAAKALALGSLATLRRIKKGRFSLDKHALSTVMEVVVSTNNLCGLPIRMWKVTRQAVESAQ